jgi:hypothetical protein
MNDISTIEKQKQVAEGDIGSPESVVTEMPSPIVETGAESTTPHPEKFYSENLEPPTEEVVNATPLPQQEVTKTETPIDIYVGYEVSDTNPASPIVRAKIKKEPIPSNV